LPQLKKNKNLQKMILSQCKKQNMRYKNGVHKNMGVAVTEATKKFKPGTVNEGS